MSTMPLLLLPGFPPLSTDVPLPFQCTSRSVFCRQAVRLGKIPFELAVDTPNAETLAAIEDVNNNRNMSKAYDNMEELMRDLNA